MDWFDPRGLLLVCTVAKRWFLAVLSGAIFGVLFYAIVLLAGVAPPSLGRLGESIGGNYWAVLVVAGGVFALATYLVHPAMAWRDKWRVLAAGWRAPGALVSAFVGSAVLGFLRGTDGAWEWGDFAWIASVSGAGWFTGRLLCILKGPELIDLWHHRRSPMPEKKGVERFREDPESVVQWFLSDEPIRADGDDLFGHAVVAESIAKKILSEGMSPRRVDGSIKPRISSGIVLGRRGMGKTSVCNLVQKQLNELSSSRRVVLLNLSAWEYAKSRALRKAVVRRLIRGIGSVGSGWGLMGLPAEYTSVIGLGGGFWGRLSNVLSKAGEPEELVQAVGERAAALGVEVVVWIDDTERVGVGEVEVDSLLYLIRETPGISFVLAYSPEGVSGRTPDSHKLADFSQGIHANGDQILRIVGFARNRWVEEHRSRGLFGKAVNDHSILHILSLGHVMFEANFFITGVQHLAAVIGTPRNLKACLRRVHRGWVIGGLAGEIDLDSLILFSALVECGRGFQVDGMWYPWIDIFADSRVMADVHASVRKSESSYSTELGKKISKAVTDFREVADHPDPLAAAELGLFKKLLALHGHPNPQSFASDRGLTYVRRAIDEGMVDDKSDQAGLRLLRRLEGCEDKAISEFASSLFDGFESDQALVIREVQQTGVRGLLPKIAEAVTREAIKRSGGLAWNKGADMQPIHDFGVMLRNRGAEGEYGVAAAECALKSRRLTLAHELLYWWGPDREILNGPDWAVIAQRLQDAFVAGFENNEAALADELSRGKRWVLHWVIRMQWVKNLGSYDPLSWKAIAPILLRASSHNPQAVAVALSVLYTDGDAARGRGLDPQSVEFFYKLFGDDLRNAMQLLAAIDVETMPDLHQDNMSADANRAERLRLQGAVEGAKQWLAAQSKS